MKLSQKQLLQIEKYLDFKELTQVDLRNEVLDHMALNIENAIENDKINFKDAFNIEIELWKGELESSSSAWLGWYWSGPKLLMQKCVREIKQMYLWSVISILVFVILISFFNKAFNIQLLNDEISISLGILYLIIFVFGMVGFFKMKASKIETTYRHLYKINAIGFFFMYLTFNPLWSDSLRDALFNEDAFFAILIHGFLIVFGSHFLALYRKHFEIKKRLYV